MNYVVLVDLDYATETRLRNEETLQRFTFRTCNALGLVQFLVSLKPAQAKSVMCIINPNTPLTEDNFPIGQVVHEELVKTITIKIRSLDFTFRVIMQPEQRITNLVCLSLQHIESTRANFTTPVSHMIN